MVRKKMKRAPAARSTVNGTTTGNKISNNTNDINSNSVSDITGTAASWLRELGLVGHDLIPALPDDWDIFSLVPLPGKASTTTATREAGTTHSQARGLQALRVGVIGGEVPSESIGLILLVALLLFIDPGTSYLRKAVKSLLVATERVMVDRQQEDGTNTNGVYPIVELVSMRLAAHWWDVYALPQSTQRRESPGAEQAIRLAASLQRLIDIPIGKDVVIAAQNGELFLRFISLLDAALGAQLRVIREWHGLHHDVAGHDLMRPRNAGGAAGLSLTVPDGAGATSESDREGGKTNAPATLQLSKVMDNSGEILRATTSLMSLTEDWDAKRLPGGEISLRRMCTSCLHLLSAPDLNRETATHASAVLIRSALAHWRSRGRWPSGDPTSSGELAAGGELPTVKGLSNLSPRTARQERDFTLECLGAATTISESFFPAHKTKVAARGVADVGMAELIAGFMPLPPSSALAICRALIHVVDPRILLARYVPQGAPDESSNDRNPVMGGSEGQATGPVEGGMLKGNLMLGAILRTIVTRGGADSGLPLRFLALQVLEAWCSKAITFTHSGLCLEAGRTDSFGKSSPGHGHGNGEWSLQLSQSLSQVMDLTMFALVHPSKLISSMAPVLLEHYFTLRLLANNDNGEVDGTAGPSEPEQLVMRVLQQSATSKGKYVALAVLLPRVGALRSLELCPSLVEQLVWAVGVRGNVAGQAVSLLLQLLKALGTELFEADEVSAGGVVVRKGPSGTNSGKGKERKESPSDRRAFMLSRGYWTRAASAALMQEDLWSRSHVAAYLLPEMFKRDPDSVMDLFRELRSRSSVEGRGRLGTALLSRGTLNEASVGPEERRMWAMIEAARIARMSGAACGLSTIGGDAGETGGSATALLHLDEVKWAALHVDETLRMSALSLLCADVRVTTVPGPAETRLLQEVLPYSLKVNGAQGRQLLLRAMQTLLVRMRETSRVCTKSSSRAAPSGVEGVARAAPAPHGGGKGPMKQRSRHRDATELIDKSQERCAAEEGKTGLANVAATSHETPAQTVDRVNAFLRWLCQELLRSLYPGCPFEREVVGLEMVQLILSELLPMGDMAASKKSMDALVEAVHSCLFCRHWVDTLLSLLGSSWDRSRSLAFAILALFPRPLSGYDGPKGAIRLAAQGLWLSGSGRQRESDRGALVVRLVFRCYARGLGLRVPLLEAEVGGPVIGSGASEVGPHSAEGFTTRGGDVGQREDQSDNPSACFLEELCRVLSHRLDVTQESFGAVLCRKQMDIQRTATASTAPLQAISHTSPLPHGILLAAQYVLVDSQPPKRLVRGGGVSDAQRASRRGATPRRKEDQSALTAGSNGVVHWRRRQQVAGLLLKQAFRALELSLLVVGENDDGSGDDGGLKEEHDDMVKVATGDPSLVTHRSREKYRSSLSVNANGHMGMVSLDGHHHGHGATPSSLAREGDGSSAAKGTESTEFEHKGDNPDLNDGRPGAESVPGKRQADAEHQSALEGQRAVVGAWLLAKEACRFLATIVAASPLPSGEDEIMTASTPTVPAGGVDLGDVPSALDPQVSGTMQASSGAERMETTPEKPRSLLGTEEISAIGDILLKALLSLKHMGCVASAQSAFQAVCEALLNGGHRNASLIDLPCKWLDQLLRQLAGDTQEFVLRRSSGLAFAFMAVLRAEPRSVDPVLLPKCMQHLLSAAMANSDVSTSEIGAHDTERTKKAPLASDEKLTAESPRGDWKSTVHAMNVLRVVFSDATLADDVGPYVTEATTAAVCGFEHPVWAVRNSSMMLFASVVQRSVGGAKNAEPSKMYSEVSKRPHAARGAVTADAFFQQHPRLHPFLLSKLEKATRQNGADASTKSPRDAKRQKEVPEAIIVSRHEMQPVLYPILLLLARLKVGNGMNSVEVEQGELPGVSGRQATSTHTASFVPLIIRCSSNPHFLARLASSRALASMLPPAQSLQVMNQLLGRLPKNEEGVTSAGAGSHNRIHGTLLQVLAVLVAMRPSTPGDQRLEAANDLSLEDAGNVNTGALANVSKKEGERGCSSSTSTRSHSEEVLSKLGATVLDLLWLADPAKSRCPPIRLVMLQILEELAGFAADVARGSTHPVPVLSALQITQENNLSYELASREHRHLVPGRSLLVFAVVGAVVRRALLSSLVGKGDPSNPDATSAVNASLTVRSCAGTRGVGVDGVKETVNESSEQEKLLFAVGLLSCPDKDIRDAAIKAFKKTFGSADLRKSRAIQTQRGLLVWDRVVSAFITETYPPNVRRLLRLLARVGFHVRDASLSTPVAALWNRLLELCEGGGGAGSESVHAGALEVMGVVMRLGEAQSGDSGSGNSKRFVGYVEKYADLLADAVDAAQPVVIRAAAVASLASSSFLSSPPTATAATAASAAAEVAVSSGATVAWPKASAAKSPGEESEMQQGELGLDRSISARVKLWFVALSLLQDENESVRNSAARACAGVASDNRSPVAGNTQLTGGRVDLCAVDAVLAHLADVAEHAGGDLAAEHVALNLLRMLGDITGTASAHAQQLVTTSTSTATSEAGESPRLGKASSCDGAELTGAAAVSTPFQYDVDEGEDMIFGHEERNQFQEPTLFARVAARYLCRTLVALARRNASRAEPLFPDSVVQAIAGVLNSLSVKLGELDGQASATWCPGVYDGIVSSVVVAAAVFEFFSTRDWKSHSENGDDHGPGVGVPVLSEELAHARKACENFESTCKESEDVHPDVSEAVTRALAVARSSYLVV